MSADKTQAASIPDDSLPAELLPGFLNGHVGFRILVSLYVFLSFRAAHALSHRLAWLVPIGIVAIMTASLRTMGGLKVARYKATIHVILDLVWRPTWLRITRTTYSHYPMHQLLVDVVLIGWLVAQTHGMASIYFILFPVVMASGDLALHGTGNWQWGSRTIAKRLWKRSFEFSAVVLIVITVSCVAAYMRWVPQIDELELVVASPVTLRSDLYWVVFACQLLIQIVLGYVAHQTSTKYIEYFRRKP